MILGTGGPAEPGFSEAASPSRDFEARLFSAAEDLLGARRERLAARAAARRRRREGWVRLPLRPSFQFALLTALLLIAINLPRADARPAFTFADLPALPQSNDSGAKYDVERVREESAYRKEVEDAHRDTQGAG